MITINNDAYVVGDNNGYELFIKKIVNLGSTDSTKPEKEVFVGGKFSSSLSGILRIYAESYLLGLAEMETAISLGKVQTALEDLKKQLTTVYTFNTKK